MVIKTGNAFKTTNLEYFKYSSRVPFKSLSSPLRFIRNRFPNARSINLQNFLFHFCYILKSKIHQNELIERMLDWPLSL